MGNYNDFDLDIKKVEENNEVTPASVTTVTLITKDFMSCGKPCTKGDTCYNSCGITCGSGCR